MKDWMIRALKTFVQAFFGILVPELVLFLNGSIPKDFEGMKVMMIPMLCSRSRNSFPWASASSSYGFIGKRLQRWHKCSEKPARTGTMQIGQ